jgi:hypothetical protein
MAIATPSARGAPRRRVAIVGLATLLVTGTAYAAWPGFALVPHHVRSRPAATLSAALSREAAAELDGAATPEAAIEAAVRVAGRHLHFGLGHRRSGSFDVAEREAHCVEYAHLTGALVARWSRTHGGALRVEVVRSQARLFGARVPMRGWGDHDWVLVEGGGRRWYVDPTFADMGLGWDLRRNVEGL